MSHKLENGQEWRDGKLYGWTGSYCRKCLGHGVDDENRACPTCAGTGEEWGLMPEQPK